MSADFTVRVLPADGEDRDALIALESIGRLEESEWALDGLAALHRFSFHTRPAESPRYAETLRKVVSRWPSSSFAPYAAFALARQGDRLDGTPSVPDERPELLRWADTVDLETFPYGPEVLLWRLILTEDPRARSLHLRQMERLFPDSAATREAQASDRIRLGEK